MKSEPESGSAGEVLRTFVALEIGEDVRASLRAAQERLKAAGASVSWVPVGNIHLTLVFLGHIFESRVAALAEGLDQVAGKFEPFAFEVTGLGVFGSARHPRVIWAGVQAPPVLEALQREVAGVATSLGIALDDRPFRPHLTLGRVRGPQNLGALTSAFAAIKNTPHGSVRVGRLLLMRSQLDPRGARYSVLHESRLKGA